MHEYKKLNTSHKGPIIDPCTEYTAKQAVRLCNIKTGQKILDYGCSIGRAARIFKEQGVDVYGVDVIPENLEKAANYCIETLLRTEQSIPLPWGIDFFDIIFSSQVIEHLYRRDGYSFLVESYDLLRSGGKIFITTPNPHYLHILLKRRPMIRGCHLSSWIIEEMLTSLKELGFKNLYWKGNGRMATFVGDWVPCRWIYGGYAIVAEK